MVFFNTCKNPSMAQAVLFFRQDLLFELQLPVKFKVFLTCSKPCQQNMTDRDTFEVMGLHLSSSPRSSPMPSKFRDSLNAHRCQSQIESYASMLLTRDHRIHCKSTLKPTAVRYPFDLRHFVWFGLKISSFFIFLRMETLPLSLIPFCKQAFDF